MHFSMPQPYNDNFIWSYLIRNSVTVQFISPETAIIILPVFIQCIYFWVQSDAPC